MGSGDGPGVGDGVGSGVGSLEVGAIVGVAMLHVGSHVWQFTSEPQHVMGHAGVISASVVE